MKAEEKALNILIVFERVKFSQNVEYNKKLAKQCAAICVQREIDLCKKLIAQSGFIIDGKMCSVIEYIAELQSVLTSIQKQ